MEDDPLLAGLGGEFQYQLLGILLFFTFNLPSVSLFTVVSALHFVLSFQFLLLVKGRSKLGGRYSAFSLPSDLSQTGLLSGLCPFFV